MLRVFSVEFRGVETNYAANNFAYTMQLAYKQDWDRDIASQERIGCGGCWSALCGQSGQGGKTQASPTGSNASKWVSGGRRSEYDYTENQDIRAGPPSKCNYQLNQS